MCRETSRWKASALRCPPFELGKNGIVRASTAISGGRSFQSSSVKRRREAGSDHRMIAFRRIPRGKRRSRQSTKHAPLDGEPERVDGYGRRRAVPGAAAQCYFPPERGALPAYWPF